MSGRTPSGAAQQYRRQLQRLLSAVTDQVVTNLTSNVSAEVSHELLLAKGQPARLGVRSNYSIKLKQQYRIAPQASVGTQSRWVVVLTTYSYQISELNGQAILSYHWHPETGHRVTQPHLHLDAGAHVGRDELQRAHFPTNLITVADIVRFAITELGVEPRRRDWETVLAQAESAG